MRLADMLRKRGFDVNADAALQESQRVKQKNCNDDFFVLPSLHQPYSVL
jgi:hypothetical protein